MWVLHTFFAAWWAYIMCRSIRGVEDDARINLVFASFICIVFFTGAAIDTYREQHEVEATE